MRRFIANTAARIRAEAQVFNFSLLTHAQFALALSTLVAAGSTVYAARLPAAADDDELRERAELIAAFTVFSAAISPFVLQLWWLLAPILLVCGGALAGASALFAGVTYVARKILLHHAAAAPDTQ